MAAKPVPDGEAGGAPGQGALPAAQAPALRVRGPQGVGWAAAPRGRAELLAVGLFCLAFAVVPLVTTELYPFSRAPMFADAPTHYCDYTVVTPDGERLSDNATLTRLGLQRNYWGNPLGVGVGFRPAESVDVFGETATEQQVRAAVAERLRRFPQWDYVDVEQRVVGPTDGDHVGVTRTDRWRVFRTDEAP